MTLCTEFALRASMSDDEFWYHVLPQPPEPIEWDDDPPSPHNELTRPCAVCHVTGPCAYDSEGRTLVHAEPQEDDDD